MTEAVESAERPDWITGRYNVIENEGGRHIVVTAQARVELHGAPSDATLTVRVGAHQGLGIRAEGSEPGFALMVELEVHASLTLDVDVESVNVSSAGRSASVTLGASVPRLALTGPGWQLQKQGGKNPEIAVLTLQSKERTQVSGHVPLRRLKSPGAVTVENPILAGFTAEVIGELKIVGDLPANSDVHAGKLTVTENIDGSSRIVAGRVSAVSVTAGPVRGNIETDTTVHLMGDCANMQIVAGGEVRVQSLTDAAVTCERFLHVEGSVERSTIRVSRTNEIVGAVVGHPVAPVGLSKGYAAAEMPEQTVESASDIEIEVPQGWIRTKHAVTDSTIEVDGQGLCLLPNVRGSRLRADAIQVDGHLIVTGDSLLSTGNLWCRKMTVDWPTDQPGIVVVLEHLQLNAPLHSRLSLTVGGEVALRPLMKGDKRPTPEISANHALLRKPLPAGLQLSASGRLVARLPDDGRPVLRVGDVAVLEGGKASLSIIATSEPRRSQVSVNGVDLALDILPGTSAVIAPVGETPLTLAGSVFGELTVKTSRFKHLILRVVDGSETGYPFHVGSESTERKAESTLSLGVHSSGYLELRGDSSFAAVSAHGYSGDLELKLRLGYAVRASLTVPEDARVTGLIFSGPGSLELHGEVEKLVASGRPALALAGELTAIDEAVGELRLAQPFEGRIHGPSRPRTRYPRTSRKLSRRDGRHAPGPGGQSRVLKRLSIVGVAPPDRPEGRAGRIIDVDMTGLPFGDIEHLTGFEVIEPTPWSLRRLATKGTARQGPAGRADLRSRSEKLTRLLAVIDEQAVAGSSRAAAKWSAARLHHRSLPMWSWEWMMRWPHYCVGYSQNPLWAAVTLAGGVMLVVALRVLGWLIRDTPFGWLEIGRAARTAFIQPLRLVRFSEDAEVLFWNPLFNLAAFALVAVPFLYFVIALRNYLKTPGE